MASNLRRRILAFGASLTEGYYSDGLQFHPYTIRLSHLLHSLNQSIEIDNAGVSGEAILSPTMLPRLKELLSKNSKYDFMLLLAGTNDTMRDQQFASRIFEGYQLLINECHKYSIHVLCMTLPETSVPLDSPYDRQRQEFNRLIREKLKSKDDQKIIVLDIDRLLPQHSLTVDQRQEIWDDDIHLTPKGYDRLGELIYETLKNYYK